jgi:hypothetical protein
MKGSRSEGIPRHGERISVVSNSLTARDQGNDLSNSSQSGSYRDVERLQSTASCNTRFKQKTLLDPVSELEESPEVVQGLHNKLDKKAPEF